MREALLELVFAVMVVTVLAFAGSRTVADLDLWGHVRFGQDILAAHSLPRQDPSSFTSDRPWVNHEWLAEMLMAGAYTVAGSAGLIALKWALCAATLAVLWRALRRAGSENSDHAFSGNSDHLSVALPGRRIAGDPISSEGKDDRHAQATRDSGTPAGGPHAGRRGDPQRGVHRDGPAGRGRGRGHDGR